MRARTMKSYCRMAGIGSAVYVVVVISAVVQHFDRGSVESHYVGLRQFMGWAVAEERAVDACHRARPRA